MRREFLVSLILASMLLIPISFAQTAPNRLACALTTGTLCDTEGVELMRLSATTNAHGEAAGGSYPQVLCCTDSQGGAIQGLGTSCSESLSDTVLRLSATTNAHAQVSGSYPEEVCLSVSSNPAVTDLDCKSETGSCTGDYAPVVRLSATTNAHLEDPYGSNYGTVICCRVGMDDTPPQGVLVSYVNGYHTSSTLPVSVDEGTDPETSITSTELWWKRGSLNGNGVCTNWGGYESYDSWSSSFPGEVSITADSGTCYMFNYSSTNTAELTTTATSTSVAKVDLDEPTTTATYLGGETHGGDVDIPLSCEDPDGSGCMVTYYCVYNEGEPSPCTPIEVLGPEESVTVTCNPISEVECFKILRFYSRDNAGNTESTSETDVIHIDTSLPQCDFTGVEPEPQPGGYVNPQGGSITLKWVGSDPAGAEITKYEILYDDGSGLKTLFENNNPSEGEQSHSFTKPDGDYSFYCRITNEDDDYSTSGAFDIFIDGSPPTMELSAPAWTTKDPGESFNVSWVADKGDGSPISRIVVTKDTGSGQVTFYDETVTSGDGSAEYTLGSEATITFQGTAHDKAGNQGDSEEVTTRVDTSPPVCTLDSLDEYQTHNSFPVSWSGTDAWGGGDSSLDVGGSILYTVEYSVDQSEWTTLPGAAGTEDEAKSMPGQDGKTYQFRCMGEDAAGNEGSWSVTESTTVDSSPPEIDDLDYSTSIAKDEYNNISIKISDAVGIESVILTIDNEEIDPSIEDKDGNEWELVWYFMALDIGTKAVKLTMTDINGNSAEETFNFTIKACIDGDVRECDPKDSDTGTTYSEGVCRHTGTRTCSDGMWGECTGGTLPSKEDCNELDDDCDGDIDESQDGGLLVKTCGTDAGVCSAGLMTCIDGNWSLCAGEEGPNPEGEICGNNLDDDCDGVSDEDCDCEEGETQPCGVSNVGECKFGVQRCENGKWSITCDGSIDPVNEVCTGGLDDDCDGDTDCDDSDCSLDSSCAGASTDTGDGTEPFPIGNILMLLGVIVMGVLLFLWYWFRKAGQQLTWEALRQKWGG